LIAGDVFSPVLYFLTDKDNPLRNQLESFNDLSLLDIRMALPGHGDVFTSIKGIIEHFESHHKGRSSQIVEALTNASMDAYEVASRLAKDAQQSGDWESLPHILKYIAARDCFAHLLHLEAAGRVMKKAISGRIVYSPAEDGEHRR